jgi:hypothetical protein
MKFGNCEKNNTQLNSFQSAILSDQLQLKTIIAQTTEETRVLGQRVWKTTHKKPWKEFYVQRSAKHLIANRYMSLVAQIVAQNTRTLNEIFNCNELMKGANISALHCM